MNLFKESKSIVDVTFLKPNQDPEIAIHKNEHRRHPLQRF